MGEDFSGTDFGGDWGDDINPDLGGEGGDRNPDINTPNPNTSGMFDIGKYLRGISDFGPGENPRGGIGTFGGLGGRENTGLFDQFLAALTGKGGQAVGGALGGGAALAGLIQALMNGGQVSNTTVTRRSSPQEQQLTGQTLQALQRLQGLAGNQEISNAVNQLASGHLPISPDLVKQVTAAFGATAGGLAQNSIDNARQRGFSGGTDLLPGAGSPQYSQSLAQLQSDVSSALVNLALGLPTAAGNLNAQQGGILSGAIGQQNDLLRALQSQNQQQSRTQGGNSIFQALLPFSQALGGTGGLIGGLNAFQQPRQQQQQNSPYSQPNSSVSGSYDPYRPY